MSFNIEFDYRFDTNNFATTEVRAALEEAARVWEGFIQDEFPNFEAGQTVTIQNPQTGQNVSVTIDQEIDDLLIFVGARDLPGNTLGFAGPSGANAAGDANQLRITNDFRGQGPTTDFEPFIGTVVFDPTVNWSFSIDAPTPGRPDFISTALHEIGHILGFSTASTFESFVNGSFFNGPNALAANNGQPIPLEPDLHVQEGFRNDTVLLDPALMTGTRTLPSAIDLALLADIGFEINGFTTQGTSFDLATEQGEVIFGRDISDTINGLGGDDQIQGGDGDDHIQGGAGTDAIFGQGGVDRFYLSPGDGASQIGDFDFANETIVIDPAFGLTSASEVLNLVTSPFSNARELALDGGASVFILENNTGTQLTAANIEFGILPEAPEAPLVGSAGNDTLVGTAGDDAIAGTAGSDSINGGAGTDTIIYNFSRSQVVDSVLPNGEVQITLPGGDVDQLTNIERVELTDGAYIFDIRDEAQETYRLYSAALAREPDEAGLRFWDDARQDGFTFDQLSQAFVDSPEFNGLFGGAGGTPPTSEVFIDALFNNVLGRVADLPGREFWIDAFNSGVSRADMLEFFSESPENLTRNEDNYDDGFFVLV